MLQLQVSRGCRRRFQSMRDPWVKPSSHPKLAGLQVSQLRVRPGYLTLCVETDDVMKYGAAEVLTKPVDFERLKQSSARAIAERTDSKTFLATDSKHRPALKCLLSIIKMSAITNRH